MLKLNKRQIKILDLIRSNKNLTNKQIIDGLSDVVDNVSRVTIVRDLDKLINQGLILKKGQGRSVYYEEKLASQVLRFFSPIEYFKIEADKRLMSFGFFNFDVFKELNNIFTIDEIKNLEKLNKQYRQRIKKLSPTIIKKEFERLTIELSWKSSQIEGNTYSLIDTEILIKENQEAKGHKKEEAMMILNHKKALDYIWQNKASFKKITLQKIESIHRLLVSGLGISLGIRKRAVGITGTKFKPLDNQHQIREALEKTVLAINKLSNPFTKALAIILLISYVQAFEDGNKRTGRILGDAILLAYDICPLSFRSIDGSDYKKAVILFYEQNSAKFFKELFMQQFEFAVNNYFL